MGINITVTNIQPGLRTSVQQAEYNYIHRLDDLLTGNSTTLQSELNQVMVDRAGDKVYIHSGYTLRPKFKFSPANSGMTEMRSVFDNIRKVYDDYIDSKIGTVPLSDERVALFSLAYNTPSLLGSGLRNAISVGDRAEAWYEIRYHSNKENGVPLDTRKGLQKRRYLEANMFSLYNKTPTEDDYKAAYRMFTYGIGTEVNDLIIGGNGMDVLLGEGGDDVLIGGKGNDILDGGASGHDYLHRLHNFDLFAHYSVQRAA